MSTEDFKSYDDMPYTSYPFNESHPSRLKAIAQIFGLNAASLTNARVLELGCASGGNLTPLAFYYPNMQLVGVDYSSVQINDGMAMVQQLGLSNVELKHMSIADITPDLGKFDYIICHGVYSWVPAEVQDAIMRVCHENLTDNGVAYVSYNVYPGWKAHEIARDAMLFHTRNINKSTEQVAHARGMIQYMHEMSADGSMFRHIMNNESELIQKAAPYYIAHEFLETHNSPCYFNQFINRAQAQGLSYLGETSVASMFAENLGEEHKQRLINASGGEQVMLEQYLDFLSNRAFRQTLLVKNAFATQLNRNIQSANIKQQTFVAATQRVASDEPSHQYENSRKRSVYAHTVTQQTALKILSEQFPNPLNYVQLSTQTQQQADKNFSEAELLRLLEQLLVIGFIDPWGNTQPELYISRQHATPTHPKIDTLVGAYALKAGHLTSHLHIHMPLNPVLSALLPLLDGSHSIDDLTAHIIAAAQQGLIQFQRNGTLELVTDASEIASEAHSHTVNNIETLKINGYLRL